MHLHHMFKTGADIKPSGIVEYGKEARILNFKVGDWALVTLWRETVSWWTSAYDLWYSWYVSFCDVL